MTSLFELSPTPPPQSRRMTDGSELFPYLWRYFLSHEPLRDWLMRRAPFQKPCITPRNVSQGIAFCCNFSVPDIWTDLAASFNLGEMFIPDHSYKHFMCGSVVAATSLHKHLVCALGNAAKRNPAVMSSYQTNVRRMVVDMTSAHSINIIEFSWMSDGALIVTTKILVPPNPNLQHQLAGCSGAFALFRHALPGADPPLVPSSLVSFVEAPRCPQCIKSGALGCYCASSALRDDFRLLPDEYSSAVWPPKILNRVTADIDHYHNVKKRLHCIQHVAHVKITAHVINTDSASPFSYRLGPSRFVVKAVSFRPSTAFEADTLRQVADKLRILRAGVLSITRYTSSDAPSDDNSPGTDQYHPQLSFTTAQSHSQHQASHVTSFQTSEECSQVSTIHTRCSCGRVSSKQFCMRCGKVNPKPGLDNVSTQNSRTFSRVSELHSIATSQSSAIAKLRCKLCNKTFSQQGSLNRHLKNIHEERKIPCQYCHMTFGQMFDLKRHQKRKHPDKYCGEVTKRERVDVRIHRATVPSTQNSAQ